MSDHTLFPSSVNNPNVRRVMSFLKSNEAKAEISRYSNIVLIVGNTGSGKTTLTKFLTGNTSLTSTELGRDSGEFIISDITNGIGRSTSVISKTMFPEVIVDELANIVYVDCTGFGDNRNEAYDITAAYLLRKLLQSAKNIKIVLTISHPSVRKGVNRNDFLQLLEYVTTLFKDITSYEGSVALIATKVDNQYVAREGSYVMVPDTQVIQNIAEFLLEVDHSLDTLRNLDEICELNQCEKTRFYENSHRLLKILLRRDASGYPNLGIFRRPDAPGELSEIAILQQGKHDLKTKLEHLDYSSINVAHLGYPISARTKNSIAALVEQINRDIIVDTKLINDILVEYFEEFHTLSQQSSHSYVDQFRDSVEALSRIRKIADTATPREFAFVLETNLSDTCKTASKIALDDICSLGEFLEFLQAIANRRYVLSAWRWAKELEEAVRRVEKLLVQPGFIQTILQQWPVILRGILDLLAMLKR